jgi:hypothetical protein
MKLKILALAATALTLAACANDYQTFYRPNANPIAPGTIVAFNGEPTIRVSTGNPLDDVNALFTEGYYTVGYANFNAADRGVYGAIAQAKLVHAAVVVVNKKYTNTVSGAIPLTLPTSQTTYSSGTVNAVGSGGFATGTYNGTSTTYGTQTTMIPYSINRYDQTAIFAAPMVPGKRWGVLMRPLNAQETTRFGTQRAVVVQAVWHGSAAFNADIIPGDVLVRINGVPMTQPFPAPTAHDCFDIQRGDRVLTKCVDLPELR